MVRIRLKRMGMKKKPFYRVVVADIRKPRDGRFIEEIGYYNPLTDPADIKIDAEKATKWLKNGAQPTDTVRILLKKAGIIEEGHEGLRPVGSVDPKKKKEKAKPAAAAKVVEEAPAKEAPVEEAPAVEAPVEAAPTEEAPAVEAPVEAAPVEEAPAPATEEGSEANA